MLVFMSAVGSALSLTQGIETKNTSRKVELMTNAQEIGIRQ